MHQRLRGLSSVWHSRSAGGQRTVSAAKASEIWSFTFILQGKKNNCGKVMEKACWGSPTWWLGASCPGCRLWVKQSTAAFLGCQDGSGLLCWGMGLSGEVQQTTAKACCTGNCV